MDRSSPPLAPGRAGDLGSALHRRSLRGGLPAPAAWTGAGSWNVDNSERHADAIVDADGSATVV